MNTSSKKIPTTVTVVIPTYNRAEKLSRLLASIKNQVISADIVLEVLVIDNASTDRTSSVCTSAGVQHTTLESNRMSSYAREIGLNKTKATYVFFVDDDNVLDTKCIATLVEQMEGDQDIGMCAPLMLKFHQRDTVWCAGAKLTKYYFPKYDFAHKNIQEIPKGKKTCGYDYFPNAYMVRRSVLNRHNIRNNYNLFPHNWGETDFGLQIKKAGYKLCTALDAITYHDVGYDRTGTTRISIDNAFDQARSRIIFFRKYQKELKVRIAWIFLFFPYFILFYTKKFVKEKERFRLIKSFFLGMISGIRTPLN